MSKVIALTLTVREHWRWLMRLYQKPIWAEGIRSSFVELNLHGFTHADAPIHYLEGEDSIDKVPLDKFMGEAAVVNLSHLGADGAVTAAELEKYGSGWIRTADQGLMRASFGFIIT